MDRIRLPPVIRSACRLALLAGMVLCALPAAVQAAPGKSCDPFCGVLHFMTPPHSAAAVAAHRPPARVAHAVAARGPRPRIVYAAVAAAPRVYVRPRMVYWPVVYRAYGYPGYGYVYYYLVPVY